ncbi:SubName: Full=Related to serine/threonine-protein kinase {ECO:0000313/EMBL:CCA69109.1} [Serendipita indica DSM 11827]|uniref:Related to serine/threonine-protein kinase n=1 Tax=Serendipita indica (strain DSM 11827) TaxID=1109443 RepID=G4TCT3_SERID|nr:SubName: Full=Related to serine/threonine-protein kinase {ECO:0000313/EMBL:CCA69109.1} [Serendipita indica DSM 11827]CCA69109.1 related to serine/threonine-protein kinase [Serendipita indica DSM 11827]
MSAGLLDPLPPSTPTSSNAFPRPSATGFLSKSQENVLDAALPQSVSRPNSRRSSRIFTSNFPLREDSFGSYYGINHFNNTWADSPVSLDSPTHRSRTPVSATSPATARQKETSQIGSLWGVSSIGRGFDWTWSQEPEPVKIEEEIADEKNKDEDGDVVQPLPRRPGGLVLANRSLSLDAVQAMSKNSQKLTLSFTDGSLVPNALDNNPQTRPTTPGSIHSGAGASVRDSSRPTSPRFRRRSSQKRFSLVAGRVSYTPPPSPPPDASISHNPNAPKLLRLASTSSFMSVNSAIAAPPTPGVSHYTGDRSIAEFVVKGEIGRGAYGLVKRGHEVMSDGSWGPEIIIKQVIKSRILADCWKKHPTHGTIPIEIYVMLAVSSASYRLPALRPWDPSRTIPSAPTSPAATAEKVPPLWKEGDLVNGHPNVCQLLDFFEDRNFYYLILPSFLPPADGEPRPKDLFDLVEVHPQGLPAYLVRTYLGQIADGMAFLHQRGIVHRDIKDENVVLSADGSHCWLIDFGSAGVVRKKGWNSFSGTLDYASPEILRGEFYTGKEQDVWAFGVVAYVLLVGECPFATATDAQVGLDTGTTAWENLEARCGRGNEREGLEADDGGALEDAAALVRACLHVEAADRPTFDEIIQHRFLCGRVGWGGERPPRSPTSSTEGL